MLRRPATGTRIHIVWEDCFTVDPWTAVADLLEKKPWTVDVLGWFLGRTADKLWMVAGGLDRDISAAATWFIPEPMIRSWHAVTDDV